MATDTGVQLVTSLPGRTKAARIVTLAKLYLYGLQALTSRDTALFAEIGRACRAHGGFDTHNLSAYLKQERTAFVFGGKGKRQTIKLSAPGVQETAALIARLRAARQEIASQSNGTARHSLRTPRGARESTSPRLATQETTGP